jgi:acetoin utilization protein AcuB
MENRLVKAWMTTPVITVTPETTLPDARSLIAEHKIRALPVMENNKLVGIVTQRGLLRLDISALGVESWESHADLKDGKVGDVMTLKPLTILPNSTVPKAARVMLENKITALPVIENGSLVGILTNSDVLRFLIASYHELSKPVLVQNCMTDEVVTVQPYTSLLEAHGLMGTKRIRSLPVMDNNHLVGLVTRTDLMSSDPSRLGTKNNQEFSLKILTQDVEKVMTKSVITIQPDKEVIEAARLMVEHKFHVLPVVDEKQAMVGILTESDLFLMVIQKFY